MPQAQEHLTPPAPGHLTRMRPPSRPAHPLQHRIAPASALQLRHHQESQSAGLELRLEFEVAEMYRRKPQTHFRNQRQRPQATPHDLSKRSQGTREVAQY